MDLLTGAGHPVPAHLVDLDTLTPYGTLFRYDDAPSGSSLDRVRARILLRDLHAWAEQHVAK